MGVFGIKYENQIFDILRTKYNIEKEKLSRIKLSDIEENDFSTIKWEPDVLLKYNDTYIIFNYVTSYLPNSFLMNEMRKILKELASWKSFFITNNEEFIEDLSELCNSENIGIIFVNDLGAKVVLSSYMKTEVNCLISQYSNNPQDYKIPKYILEKLVYLKNVNPTYIRILREFALSYMQLQPKSDTEETLIDKVVNDLLSDAVIGSAKVLYDNLKQFENIMNTKIRDHYYHSFQVFLLGIIIIDNFYEEFKGYHKYYFSEDNDSDIEFIWLITSIFHDVGYILQKLPDMAKELIEIDAVNITVDLSNDIRFEKNLNKYTSLFGNILTQESGDWPGDGFDESALKSIIIDVCKEGHGLYSSFLILIKMGDVINSLKEEKDKRFLNRHIFAAAISISLHDSKYRNLLKEKITKSIKMKLFPFAVLLMYLDSLQEDRRNDQTRKSYEDTIKNISFDGNKVVINLNIEYILCSHRRPKMKYECLGISEFVIFDDLILEYPKWLIDGD